MSDEPGEGGHLSIGEVLSLIQEEFPDVTISKIRFLESQGLINPERTSSGYRKFYDADIARLRWVLRQQRDHFLPLKVIKARLEAGVNLDEAGDPIEDEPTLFSSAPSDPAPLPAPPGLRESGEKHPSRRGSYPRRRHAEGGSLPRKRPVDTSADTQQFDEVPPAGPAPEPENIDTPDLGEQGAHVVSEAEHGATGGGNPDAGAPAGAAPEAAPQGAGTNRSHPSEGRADLVAALQEGPPRRAPAAAAPVDEPVASEDAAVPVAEEDGDGATDGEPEETPAAPEPTAVDEVAALLGDVPDTVDLATVDLCRTAGISSSLLEELERFGLVRSRVVGADRHYDRDALVVALLAGRFAELGIEPRHLRMYKVAAEREAGFIEQVVMPGRKHRHEEERARAEELARRLVGLGAGLHGHLLRRTLLGGREA